MAGDGSQEIALDTFDTGFGKSQKNGDFRYPSSGQPSGDTLDQNFGAVLFFGIFFRGGFTLRGAYASLKFPCPKFSRPKLAEEGSKDKPRIQRTYHNFWPPALRAKRCVAPMPC